ncbi:MAG: HAMP domain-containing histidine kinase [Saprospiraceae bacterium]|nr:HAMP domain-containing histidine kinase [Saprospiraceae bacterium]MCF8251278.1 HAMP domain-containing histidine kinase [Saprospiraceae bacterium]MCF8280831.1 HAMP domain-containing histidine kinase [Bacteroidales bacterium]MCF8311815.1 HAMP domain-containing histidine kinase [Saprospiraceae bacterium]MCF8441956.1 HAMP domain-containing histidine kinase [Saprospiraceae bacterium]
MDIYKRKSRWKWYLAAAGAVIVLISMFYTKYLTDKLEQEEVKKVQQLKTALETLSQAMEDTMQCDVSFQTNFLSENTTVPILLVDEQGNPQEGRNFGLELDTNQVFLVQKLEDFRAENIEPIIVSTPWGSQHLYFEHSLILRLLKLYPILQFILIAAFIAFGYLGFSTSRRAEQNRVWAGMAKETAHQLGTPISGIVAWIEHLRALREDDAEVNEVLDELGNDVVRLELIADRFSKIGSAPELKPVNIFDELEKCRAYMQRRASRKIEFYFPQPTDFEPVIVQINSHLFEWVVENLLRNALDSMEGTGSISATVYQDPRHVFIDISDTGKGIPASKFKTVFQPGYTTKKRGWGLGLSLTKRIIDEYHSGKIFVKKSVLNEGTTFTIQLPK